MTTSTKTVNFKGIVMNRLIELRTRLESYKTSTIEAQHLDETIKMVHENL